MRCPVRARKTGTHIVKLSHDYRSPVAIDYALSAPDRVGVLDRYLSPDLATHLAGLFPKAVPHLIDGASHWPQWDQPQAVSELIRCAP